MQAATCSPLHAAGAPAPRRRGTGALILWLIGVSLVSTALFVPYLVVSSFRLERETAALREAVTGGIAAEHGWSRRVEVRLGGVTLGLVRFAAGFADLPEEARLALRAARAAEVGVYQWRGADLDSTQRLMAGGPGSVRAGGREWTRVVAVRDGGTSVAVFTPADVDDHADTVELCVLVLDGHEMVVATVRLDPEPLAELVQPHLRELSFAVPSASRN